MGIRAGFDAIARDVEDAASSILIASRLHWTFERREGAIAQELITAAKELDEPDRRQWVVIVVGAADHDHRRIGGSVPGYLVRQDRFVLTVVPHEKSTTAGRTESERF